ncbi:hypothetical protein D3C78_1316970 [compost metagenome]
MEAEIIHKKGMINIIPAMLIPIVTILRLIRKEPIYEHLLVINPFLLTDPLNNGNCQNDEKQHDADCRGISGFQLNKCNLIQIKYDDGGRACRSAVCKNHDQVKYLEGTDNSCNEQEKRSWRQQWDCNLEKLPNL